MKLRALPTSLRLKGKRVLVRVDWNVPLHGPVGSEEQLKIERSLPLIADLHARGAVVFFMTHLGRPAGVDPSFSTRKLLPMIQAVTTLPIQFLGDAMDTRSGVEAVRQRLASAEPGTLFLSENVRFWKGEEKNSPALSASIASCGDVFVNDAFASCHRSHASVVGVAKRLPAYAGPSLLQEVKALDRILRKPRKPIIAMIGGAKLSTKIPVLSALLKIADKVLIGGALAHPFFLAQAHGVGKSVVEPGSVTVAKKLLRSHARKILLPVDVVVTPSLAASQKSRLVAIESVRASDMIVDVGLKTVRLWSEEIAKAETIIWNGPVGLVEYRDFSHGSRLLARAIASRARGRCYAVVGGGDTLPVVLHTRVGHSIDHLSTGGGAMLEFIAYNGVLPGLKPLQK